ncbi:MAG: DNRLRE domain-containing protein [Phenylobacterium sp.]
MATAELTATIDSSMDKEAPTNNYGALVFLWLGANVSGGSKTENRRSILNFDVSSLAGATINSALLRRAIQSSTGGGFAATVYRCTRPADWVEAEATWNNYKSATAWTAAGGDYDASTPTPVGYTEPGATGQFDITGLAAFVTDALANRSGIVSVILRANDEAPTSTERTTAQSSETPESPPAPPTLIVDYTPAGGGFNMRNYWP